MSGDVARPVESKSLHGLERALHIAYLFENNGSGGIISALKAAISDEKTRLIALTNGGENGR